MASINLFILYLVCYSRMSTKEAEAYAEVVENYRITIPKPVRKLLGIEIGDIVRVKIEKVEGGAKK